MISSFWAIILIEAAKTALLMAEERERKIVERRGGGEGKKVLIWSSCTALAQSWHLNKNNILKQTGGRLCLLELLMRITSHLHLASYMSLSLSYGRIVAFRVTKHQYSVVFKEENGVYFLIYSERFSWAWLLRERQKMKQSFMHWGKSSAL